MSFLNKQEKPKTKILTKDDILNANDIQIELVSAPEWGGDVYVKSLTGTEVDQYTKSIIESKGNNQTVNFDNIRSKLCALAICDEKGKRLFDNKEISLLSKKNSAALIRCFKKAQSLSGLNDEDIKELADGLQENPLEDSASDSPFDLDARLQNS